MFSDNWGIADVELERSRRSFHEKYFMANQPSTAVNMSVTDW